MTKVKIKLHELVDDILHVADLGQRDVEGGLDGRVGQGRLHERSGGHGERVVGEHQFDVLRNNDQT